MDVRKLYRFQILHKIGSVSVYEVGKTHFLRLKDTLSVFL